MIILPESSNYPTFRVVPASQGGIAFSQLRGPPVELSVLPEVMPKYTLMYDSANHRWTDQLTAEAASLIELSKHQWNEVQAREHVAAGRYFMHEGDTLVVAGDLPSAFEKYRTCISEFSLADQCAKEHGIDIELAHWQATAFLKSGAVRGVIGLLDEGITDLRFAIRHSNADPTIDGPAYSLAARLFSRKALTNENDCQLAIENHRRAINAAAKASVIKVPRPVLDKVVTQLMEDLERVAFQSRLQLGQQLLDQAVFARLCNDIAEIDLQVRFDAGVDLVRRGNDVTAKSGELCASVRTLPAVANVSWKEDRIGDFCEARAYPFYADYETVNRHDTELHKATSSLSLCLEKAQEFLPRSMHRHFEVYFAKFPMMLTESTRAMTDLLEKQYQYEDRISAYLQVHRSFLPALEYAVRAAEHKGQHEAIKRDIGTSQ